ncbi:hypothetical protein AB0H97_35245 [Streptomyces sp. NPDC050788]|uniref:hypothetical protein n=1 Tax=Streptomyces sp. NPDC050788 TaxID=3155041 RepID=UPI0034218D09
MRRITRSAAALVVATAALAAVNIGSAQANDRPVYGCPGGAACIYPQNADIHTSTPTNIYYSYGAHNLSNQLGNHYVLNNQYGGANATVQLCTGYNGVNCTITIKLNEFGNYNLTPINSIVLNRP